MNAYKFRTTDDLDRVADILVNRRLYCSDVEHLNDIREADIRVGNDRGREGKLLEFGLSVTRAIRAYRVCSLSKTFNNPLLWAHYAGGSSGLVIEVPLPAPDSIDVVYDDDFIFLSDYLDAGVDAAVRAALARKTKAWQHEEEVRVIVRAQFCDLPAPIPRVIVGSRMGRTTLHAVAQLCSTHGIAIERAVVADWGVYTVGLQQVG